MVANTSPRLRAALLACAAALALATAGCNKGGEDITGSVSQPRSEQGWRTMSEEWGRRYDAKPGDKTASINYARALRMIGQRQQAVAVLQVAALKSPKDTDILAAYGKALIEVGQLQQAQDVLTKAHTPERPDWRILSAQGAIADQMGNHEEAQSLYQAALRLQPDDPGVMANLGLSYALAKRLPEAETTLRQAAANPRADSRVRQNLALVLGLQGKFGEAEGIARQDMAPIDAAQSVMAMKQMVAQPNSWNNIRTLDAKAKPGVTTVGRTAAPPPAKPAGTAQVQ